MQDIGIDQQDGPVAQATAASRQGLAKAGVLPTVADLQIGDAAAQGAQLGKMAAKRAATVKHQDRCANRFGQRTMAVRALLLCVQMVRPQALAAWRTICTCCGLILIVLWLGWTSPAALADQAGPTAATENRCWPRCTAAPLTIS